MVPGGGCEWWGQWSYQRGRWVAPPATPACRCTRDPADETDAQFYVFTEAFRQPMRTRAGDAVDDLSYKTSHLRTTSFFPHTTLSAYDIIVADETLRQHC